MELIENITGYMNVTQSLSTGYDVSSVRNDVIRNTTSYYDSINNGTGSDVNLTSTYFYLNVTSGAAVTISDDLLRSTLGPRFHGLSTAILLTVIYVIIFILGTVGNICTCVVIVQNSYMQTTTNYYLFSLAISDVLILLLALPQEAYTIWEAYPWRFGEVFCYIKALLQEMTSYASVLTITAFTVERYVAICHPLWAHKFADLSRIVKIIIAIWIISLMFALPYPLHTDLFYYIDASQNNGTQVDNSLICNIKREYYPRMTYIFQLSTFLFFVVPMTVIVVLYLLIALALRRAALQRVASQESSSKLGHSNPVSQSGRAVFRMLVAVVVCFFTCWAPFHAQRLLTIYNTTWTPVLLDIQSALFYISGVLYFVGSIVNPILYNVMSKRYRQAFIETVCHCRKERSAYTGSAGYHQSFHHTSKHKQPIKRPVLQRQPITIEEHLYKSDEENQVSPVLSNGCCIKESSSVQLLDNLNDKDPGTCCENQLWVNTKYKNVFNTARTCYRDCVNEHCATTVNGYPEKQILLSHSLSAESAC